jgi:hypothetical protein
MDRQIQITPLELRKFGLTMAGVIGLLFGLIFPTFLDWSYLNISWLFVSYFVISALLIPQSLVFIYKLWAQIGHVLNWINTKIILGLIFIFLFIPIAIFFKLIIRDQLKLKFDASANSYREIPPPDRQKLDLTKPY